MATLFNLILLWGMWPAQWTMVRIAATLKPGRNARDPNDYRPIHLMSHFAHLFLSAVRQRIAQAYRKTRYQLVFVPCGSCIITCFCLYAAIAGQLWRAAGRRCYVAFMDFVQAFDRMDRHILLVKLCRAWVHRAYIQVQITLRVFVCFGGAYSGWTPEMNGGVQGNPITP